MYRKLKLIPRFSLLAFFFVFALLPLLTSPVFAQGTVVPPPPVGIPEIPSSPTDSGTGAELPAESEIDSGDTSGSPSADTGGAGGFINPSGGQPGLNPTQYADQYQGQFFSRITTAREGFAQISNFMLSFLGSVAILFIIWGGFLYITASGDQAKLDKAKKVLWGTVMSMIIVFGIYALISTLLNIGAAVNPGVGVGPLQVGPGGTTLRVPF